MRQIVPFLIIPFLALSACGNGDAESGAASFGGGTGSGGSSGGDASGGDTGGDTGGDGSDTLEGVTAFRLDGRDRLELSGVSGNFSGGNGSVTITTPAASGTISGTGTLETGITASNGTFTDDASFAAYDHLNVYTFTAMLEGRDITGRAILGDRTPTAEMPNVGQANYSGEAAFTATDERDPSVTPTWEVEAAASAVARFSSREIEITIDNFTVVSATGGAGVLPFDEIYTGLSITGNQLIEDPDSGWTLLSGGVSVQDDVIGPNADSSSGTEPFGYFEGGFHGIDSDGIPDEISYGYQFRGDNGSVTGVAVLD